MTSIAPSRLFSILTHAFIRGESGVGNWTVIVKDTVVNEYEGVFTDWRLSLWGESINPDIQKLHPLPDIHDHDHETELPTMTTTTPPGATETASPTNGDEPTGTSAGDAIEATASSAASAAGFSDNFLPSPFPTFGVSKSTQIWIYGSLSLIIVFCATLGIYFYVQRRKRIRNNPRDDYEFEMVADDEAGLLAAGGVAGPRAAQRRRGGELYDAFAGDSEDEDGAMLSDSDRGSESDSEGARSYHDDEGTSGGAAVPKWSDKSRPSEEH